MINRAEESLKGVLAYLRSGAVQAQKRVTCARLLSGITRSTTELSHSRYAREIPSWFAKDIKASGIQVPIVITHDNVIVDGVYRYIAAQQAGHYRVPVRII